MNGGVNVRRPILAAAGVALCAAAGAAAWHAFSRRVIEVPILMYHRLGSARADVWTVRPEDFEDQMRQLRERGYHAVLPSDLVAYREKKRPLPPKPVVITFDDGALNVKEIGGPVLRRYGYRAIVYIVPGATADRPEDRRELEGSPALTWPEIREMRGEGTFDVGGHTLSHARGEVLRDPEKEIGGCFQAIREKGGFTPDSFCYAYNEGAGVRKVEQWVGKAGFSTAMTTGESVARIGRRTNFLGLPRVFVRGGRHLFEIRRLSGGAGGPVEYEVDHAGPPIPITPRLANPGSAPDEGWLAPVEIERDAVRFSFPGAGAAKDRLEIWDRHRLFLLARE